MTDNPSIQLICIATLCVLMPSVKAQEATASALDPKPKTEVHPFLENVAPAFHRLIESGRVSIEVDDERLRQVKKAALSEFRFEIRQKMIYRFRFADRKTVDRIPLRISIRFEDTHLEVWHRVIISRFFRSPSPWESPLLRHEMDHVAISTDPRMIKLVKETLWRPETWVEDFEGASVPKSEVIEAAIKSRTDDRRVSVEKLIQYYYDLLDHESRDGRDLIANRQTFFDSLYTLESLQTAKFPNLEAVRPLVRSKSYQDIDDHYSLLTLP